MRSARWWWALAAVAAASLAAVQAPGPIVEDALLAASATVVAQGDAVTISFKLDGGPPLPSAAAGDYLLFYSPATADPRRAVPFKAARAADDPLYAATGRGSRRVTLAGPRADVAVYFVRGMQVQDVWYPWLTGRTPRDLLFGGRLASKPLLLDFTDRGAPLWPRVLPATGADAPLGGGDAFRVAWQGDAASAGRAVVQWGASKELFTGQAPATAQSFGRADMCPDVPGWHDPRAPPGQQPDGVTLHSGAGGAGFNAAAGVTYSAVVSGLRRYAGQSVWYRVGDGSRPDGSGMSRPYRLHVPPLPGGGSGDAAAAGPFTLLAGADWGAAPTDDSVAYKPFSPGARDVAVAMAAEVAAGAAHAVVLGGDLAYSDGYLPLYDTWLQQTAGFAARVPVWVASGNHEAGWPGPGGGQWDDVIASGGECGVPLAALYPQPAPWGPGTPWSATRLGPACLFSVSTEHDFSVGSPQWRWLNATLASFWAPAGPPCQWIIGVAHRPMFIDSFDAASPSHDAPVMAALQRHLDPLYRAYRVNLVLSGHNHRYARNCPFDVGRGICEQRGAVAHDGAGDSTPTAVYDSPVNALHLVVGSSGAPFDHDVPGLRFVEKQVLGVTGYARIVLVNGSRMEVEWLEPVSTASTAVTGTTAAAAGVSGASALSSSSSSSSSSSASAASAVGGSGSGGGRRAAGAPVPVAGSGRPAVVVHDRFVLLQEWPRVRPAGVFDDAQAAAVAAAAARDAAAPSPAAAVASPPPPSADDDTPASAAHSGNVPPPSRSMTPGPASPSASPSTDIAAVQPEHDDQIRPPEQRPAADGSGSGGGVPPSSRGESAQEDVPADVDTDDVAGPSGSDGGSAAASGSGSQPASHEDAGSIIDEHEDEDEGEREDLPPLLPPSRSASSSPVAAAPARKRPRSSSRASSGSGSGSSSSWSVIDELGSAGHDEAAGAKLLEDVATTTGGTAPAGSGGGTSGGSSLVFLFAAAAMVVVYSSTARRRGSAGRTGAAGGRPTVGVGRGYGGGGAGAPALAPWAGSPSKPGGGPGAGADVGGGGVLTP